MTTLEQARIEERDLRKVKKMGWMAIQEEKVEKASIKEPMKAPVKKASKKVTKDDKK